MNILFFTTSKPFNEEALIQENTLKSLKRLDIESKTLLFSNEDKIGRSICDDLGVKFLTDFKKAKSGVPYLNDIFYRSLDYCDADYYCYINCDMILLQDFAEVLKDVHELISGKRFLMVGPRWDWGNPVSIDFDNTSDEDIRELVFADGNWHPSTGMDYFIFGKTTFDIIPEFLMARTRFDNAIASYAIHNSDIIDINFNKVIHTIHQDHGYTDGKGSKTGDDSTLREMFRDEFDYNVALHDNSAGWEGCWGADNFGNILQKIDEKYVVRQKFNGWGLNN